MELKAGESDIRYIKENKEIIFEGSMRLASLKEYETVKAFLKDVSKEAKGTLILNFKSLEFLNSAGITTIILFLIYLKEQGKSKVKILGSRDVPWQTKSLDNFKKLWSKAVIKFE
ncbi:MAG: hypothetical protein MI922_10870 [Bacteroidales bacterium]|nr:hypothetical protein [Bacteroidales bacterium]